MYLDDLYPYKETTDTTTKDTCQLSITLLGEGISRKSIIRLSFELLKVIL